MTLYEYSGARTSTKLGAYIKHTKKRKFYTAIVRAQNWIKTGRALRGSAGCVDSALWSWECGRGWGDGTRDLTGINYDTGRRTSAGAYADRSMTWDSDGPHGNRMCSHPGLPLGCAPRWTLQCQGRCVPGKIKLTSNNVDTFRAKDLPQLTQWRSLDAGVADIRCSHSWSQSCTHYVNSSDVAIVVSRQPLRSVAPPGKAH